MKINCTYTELRDAVNLMPHPKNYNKHPKRQIDMLAKIMNFQGWRHPIIVSKRSGFIVAGHGRLAAAQLLGWDKAPIDLQDFADEATELAFLVSDNKIAELAETDHDLLLEIGLSLGGDFDHELLGLDVVLNTAETKPMPIVETEAAMIQCPHCKQFFDKSKSI